MNYAERTAEKRARLAGLTRARDLIDAEIRQAQYEIIAILTDAHSQKVGGLPPDPTVPSVLTPGTLTGPGAEIGTGFVAYTTARQAGKRDRLSAWVARRSNASAEMPTTGDDQAAAGIRHDLTQWMTTQPQPFSFADLANVAEHWGLTEAQALAALLRLRREGTIYLHTGPAGTPSAEYWDKPEIV